MTAYHFQNPFGKVHGGDSVRRTTARVSLPQHLVSDSFVSHYEGLEARNCLFNSFIDRISFTILASFKGVCAYLVKDALAIVLQFHLSIGAETI